MNLDIAIAIIYHPSDNLLLIARRFPKAHQGDLWEFPGGKCESGESPEAAAIRECAEEVGLAVTAIERWPEIVHDYSDRIVRLYPIICRALTDDAQAIECAEVSWVEPCNLICYEFPAANADLISRLTRESQ